MAGHARLSPSGAHRWMGCVVSTALEYGIPDRSSKAAEEGTAAHSLASTALEENKAAAAYLGRKFDGFIVSDDMAEGVQMYLDFVERLRGQYTVYEEKVETWLPASPSYGFPAPANDDEPAEGSGTADYLLLAPKEGNNLDNPTRLYIVDLKFGRGVQVFASENSQLQMYIANAMAAIDVFAEVEEFVGIIVQPRVDGGWVDEVVYTRAEIEAFAEQVNTTGEAALQLLNKRIALGHLPDLEVLEYARPDRSVCRWCKAKASCPALGNAVLGAVSGQVNDFEDLTAETIADVPLLDLTLNGKMNAVGLVEDWCTAIRAEMERRLLDSHTFADWKLVEGRRGARAWKDAEVAEQVAKDMRLKHAQKFNSIFKSPPQMEHALAKDFPRKWQRMSTMIIQKEGKPSVAAMSDKRPAYTAVKENEFHPTDDSDLL